MPAELIPSPDRDQPHLLRLPAWASAGDPLIEARDALLLHPHLQGPVKLLAGEWPLTRAVLERLIVMLEAASMPLETVVCLDTGARVAAASLGLAVEGGPASSAIRSEAESDKSTPPPTDLLIHQGTLRSGDRQQAPGSILILGDVNPGAQISAVRHVLVWGRLRGIAHAGCLGDRTACIIALHLHPLQLRIAAAVARGPEEAPPAGLAEKAHLVGEAIQIDVADPFWPLTWVPPQLPGPSESGSGAGLT